MKIVRFIQCAIWRARKSDKRLEALEISWGLLKLGPYPAKCCSYRIGGHREFLTCEPSLLPDLSALKTSPVLVHFLLLTCLLRREVVFIRQLASQLQRHTLPWDPRLLVGLARGKRAAGVRHSGHRAYCTPRLRAAAIDGLE